MYNMLRHSKHYKRMQVGFTRACRHLTRLYLFSDTNNFAKQVARANDNWDKSLLGSDSLPASPQPALSQAQGGIFDDTELLAALEGFSSGAPTNQRNEEEMEPSPTESDETRRNSNEALVTPSRDMEAMDDDDFPEEELARLRQTDEDMAEEREEGGDEAFELSSRRPTLSSDGMLSVDTNLGLGRGVRPVVRSLSSLDNKGADLSRSPSGAALPRETRPRRRRGVSFDEHVFVMEEPGVMFALKSSGPLTPFTPSPVTLDSPESHSPSHDSPMVDDSDTDYSSFGVEEDAGTLAGEHMSVASAPSLLLSTTETSPRKATEHIQWADAAFTGSPESSPTRTSNLGLERRLTGPSSPSKSPASSSSPVASGNRTLRQLFFKAIGIGD